MYGNWIFIVFFLYEIYLLYLFVKILLNVNRNYVSFCVFFCLMKDDDVGVLVEV